MERGRTEFLGVTAGRTGDKEVEAILESFRDADRCDQFYQYFRELEEVYEILSPDEFLRPFLEDYRRLSEMYQILRASYEARPIASLDFLKKTARLVQEHTQGSMVREPEAVYGIDPDALRRIAGEDLPDAVKVFNLVKAIRQIVEEQARSQPYLISIGERAEAIVRAFEERQITTQETLRQLVEGPVSEIEKAEQARRGSNLSDQAFAVFWLLAREGVNAAEAAARKIAAVLDEHRHWRVSERHEREARIGIYRALREAGVDEPVPLANRLLHILRRSEE
jgi:type I restriction enzyme R subunit